MSKARVDPNACMPMKEKSIARGRGNADPCVDRLRTMQGLTGTPRVKEKGTDTHIETSCDESCLGQDVSHPSQVMLNRVFFNCVLLHVRQSFLPYERVL